MLAYGEFLSKSIEDQAKRKIGAVNSIKIDGLRDVIMMQLAQLLLLIILMVRLLL